MSQTATKSLWQWVRRTIVVDPVEAYMKSEARAEFKRRYNVPRLPVGALIRKVPV